MISARWLLSLASLAGIFLLTSRATHGQAPATLQFEVASVRPSGPLPRGGRGGTAMRTPDRLTYQYATMLRLIMDAYGVGRGQIRGPQWVIANTVDGAALFDMSARVPAGATSEQVAVMLQNLLKDRFKLAFHAETPAASGFAIVAARSGSKLTASAGPVQESERNVTTQGAIHLQIQKDGFPELYRGLNMGATFSAGTVRMRFRDYPLSDLAQQLSFALDVPITVGTGLDGRYDFTLEFTPPENAQSVGMRMTFPRSPGQGVVLSRSGPGEHQMDALSTISSAMEKQLGLRLEGARVASEILVIDHVERTPIEN